MKHPIGWQAGRDDQAYQVLWNISIEMMAHRSDLQEDALRMERKIGCVPLLSLTDGAEMLEKYATALTIATVQMMTLDQLAHSQLSGLEELAKKHGLFLPDEFKTKEK